MKKLLNVFLIFLILFTNFIPSLALQVDANTSCTFEVAIAYTDRDVRLGCFTTYNAALTRMREHNSTLEEVAVIKNAQGNIINAAYAIVRLDVREDNNGVERVFTNNAFTTYLYTTPAAAAAAGTNSSAPTWITYIAGTWAVESAFLDYNPTHNAVQLKNSGAVGWIAKRWLQIVPTSRFFGNNLTILADIPIRVRSGPGTNHPIVNRCGSTGTTECFVQQNQTFTFFPSETTQAGGFTWYRIQHSNNVTGWIASQSGWTRENRGFNLRTHYEVRSNVLYHRVRRHTGSGDAEFTLGTAPFEYRTQGVRSWILRSGVRYYSFDSNYFYTDFARMIDDYRAGHFNNATNSNVPYFAYFMYLPARAKSGYTANTFDQAVRNLGFTGFPTDPRSFVNSDTGAFIRDRGNLSMMFGIGQHIIDAQNTYGTNALAIFSAARIESGNGRSAIAFFHNNLFGMGAVDSNPFHGARTYATVRDSVMDYARSKSFGSGYTNLNDWRYAGTHQGNQRSGSKKQYASDPYAGQAAAGIAFWLDAQHGSLDNLSQTLGNTRNNTAPVEILAEPRANSRVIYRTRNNVHGRTLSNMPFIVTDKVYTVENGVTRGYYRVFTDVSLDSNRVFNNSVFYNFDHSWGWIRDTDLWVQNNQPVINAENRTVEQNSTINLRDGVTATDFEDGNLTSRIQVTGSVDTAVPGNYNVTYTVVDNQNFSVSRAITITVVATEHPVIIAPDIEVAQFTTFDPLQGVTVTCRIDGTTIVPSYVSNVNTQVMGEYTVTYTATNSRDLTTTHTRNVRVIVNESPVINATNRTVFLGETFDPLQGVVAHDKEDGDITYRLEVKGNVDINTVGTYTLTYTVTDSIGQSTTRIVTITVEERSFESRNNMLYLEQLSYNATTRKVDLTGFLVIRGANNRATDQISYDIIFENQFTGGTIIKPLSRLAPANAPFAIPNESGFNQSGAWFRESIDLSDLAEGDYTIYVRARMGNLETRTLLRNDYFKTISAKFTSDVRNYRIRTNFFNRELPLELSIRSNETLNAVNNPTIDNMFNQVHTIALTSAGRLNIMGTSHNVNGNYATSINVERWIMFENIATLAVPKTISNVGSITNGPYVVTLRVPDGRNKTRAWYNTSIDVSDLPIGTYSIIVRTRTGTIDDSGELYDLTFANIGSSIVLNGRRYTISRNDSRRFRIELTIENI